MDKKVFFADDEIAMRFLVTETLEEEGFQVTTVENGMDALQVLQLQQFDVIILDFMMPGKTGVEVCLEIRESKNPNQKVPIILLSAKSRDVDKELARQAGVSIYVTKPFSPIELLDTVIKAVSEE